MTTVIDRSLTDKQIEILRNIVKMNPDGTLLDIDQLIDKLSYTPTKAALQFSLRFLIRRGLIEKRGFEIRRGAKRRLIAPTAKGYEENRSFRG